MSQFLAFRTAVFSLLRPPRASRLPCTHRQPPSRNAHNSGKFIKHPRDERIDHRIVQLVDRETGRLLEPTSLRSILDSIDRKRSYVELVSSEPAPIVKIIDKKEAFEKRKQMKAQAKAVAKRNIHKEVQLTWGAAVSDLGHKLDRVRHELEKGSRVDLIFAPKRGQVLPTALEMDKRAQETVDMLVDVAREWKPRESQKAITAIFLQGSAVPQQESSTGVRAQKEQRHKAKRKEPAPEAVIDDIYQD